MNRFARCLSIFLNLAVGILLAGCNVEEALEQLAGQNAGQTSQLTAAVPPQEARDVNGIRIASFNPCVLASWRSAWAAKIPNPRSPCSSQSVFFPFVS